ncbi:MAG: aspartate aminotransferase family protein [Chloroflexi bacterium]|nr:aspartate aminotransferase family protein [Chloroflexota bacterium]
MTSLRPTFPTHGTPKEKILQTMQELRANDVKWREGKVFSLVFHAGDEIGDLLKEAYTMFFSENGLNPTAFPSLRRFETEVVAMVAALLGSDGSVVGNMTTGGTESLLMVVKTARDYARVKHPEIHEPEMILPASAHPGLDKAGEYFDVKAIRTPVDSDFKANVAAMRAAITPNTILLVGSAPSYPHGIVDPIPEIAALAREHNLLCHVDACVGGMMLPFVRRLGYPVTNFDFNVPGITSLSVDLHKYGYAAKGASVILYRNRELRRAQIFVSTDWAGGIYASPTMTGTRPGGSIAAAWAIMNYLGEEGYVQIADVVMKTTKMIRDGINAIDGIKIVGDPEMSVMAIASDRLDIYQVGDEMTQRGWHLDRQQFPPTLHLTINYAHAQSADQFLRDLAESVAIVKKPSLEKIGNSMIVNAARLATRVLPENLVSKLTARASALFGGEEGLPQRSAAMYGMMGTLPNRGDLKELVLDLVEGFTTPAK